MPRKAPHADKHDTTRRETPRQPALRHSEMARLVRANSPTGFLQKPVGFDSIARLLSINCPTAHDAEPTGFLRRPDGLFIPSSRVSCRKAATPAARHADFSQSACQISQTISYVRLSMMIHNFRRIRFLFRTLTSASGVTTIYSPLLVAITVVGVIIPFATGRLIDALAVCQSPFEPLAVLTALLLLRTIMTPLLQRFICTRSRSIEADLQFRVLDSTMNLDPSSLAGLQSGELVSKLIRDTNAVGGFVRGLYPQTLQAVVMMFAAGCALLTRSPILAIAFMAFFPLAILLFAPFARRFAENSHRVRRQSERSFNALFDFLMTLPMLRLLDAERRFADQPTTALKQLKEGNDEADSLSVLFNFLLGLLLVLGEIAVLVFACVLATKGRIPVGDVVLYQLLFVTAIQAVQGVISLLPDLAAVREGADSLGEMLTQPPPTHEHILTDGLRQLSFRHVTFAYPDAANRPVINNFSANFPAGSVVGLSGANGVGKSTLLKLAVNALEPQRGEILVNGHPFSEIDLPAFRRRIGVVAQDNLIINGTIRDNITLRNPNFTQDDINRALSLSGFDSVTKRLPNGLDTIIGNQVRSLSGGERQRLAIARAVIRNPFILVLDEATNHLDAESRKTFAGLVARLRPERLILIAGHDTELDNLCDMKISCQISKNTSYVMV